LLLGAEFTPAVGLIIFTSTQSYDAAIKVGQTMEAQAMSNLYFMAAQSVIDGETSAINGSGVDTLLKTPQGKALIRQATGGSAPLPLQRGVGIFDSLFEDRFDEFQAQNWMKANAMEIYTYLNLYMEAGGHYPLAMFKSQVDLGYLPERYAQENWRKNVLPYHQRARDELDRRIRALEEKARKNCF
jgi:predicted lipoprotein